MLMLDTQTLDGAYRLSSFGEDGEEILKDFFRWINEVPIKAKDIWYADIFDMNIENSRDPERIGILKPVSRTEVEILPMPDRKSPFRKRVRPLKGNLKWMRRRLFNR